MSFTLVQSATGSVGSANATSATVTTSATGSSHLLVAFVYVHGANLTITAPTGWSQVGTTQGVNGSTGTIAMFYLQNSTSGVTSFVFSFSASCNAAVAFEEWSGVATSSALDQFVAQQNAKSTAASTGTTAALAGTGELAIWGLSIGGTVLLTYSGTTNSYVEDTSANASSTESVKAQATLFHNTSVGSAATSSATTMSGTGSVGNTTILAVFKPAAGTTVTKSLQVRFLQRVQNTKSLAIRFLQRVQATKSLQTRIRLALGNHKAIPVRLRLTLPAHAYTATIGGQAVLIEQGTLLLDNAVGKRSTGSFTVHLQNPTTHFQQYEEVEVFDQNGVLVYSGYITSPVETKPGFQTSLEVAITVCDQHYLADKRVIADSYENQTCGFMVNNIVINILAQEGVTVGRIDAGPVVPSAVFVYCTVAQALDEIVKAASASGAPWYWQIDQNKKIWFVSYTAIVNSTVVDGTLVEMVNNPPQVTRANPLYRNTQYLLGGVAQTSSQSKTIKGDGVTSSWPMDYDLALVPTITVNSVTKTLGIKGLDTGKDFYWAKGDPIIAQDSSATKLISTDTMVVTYTGQYPIVSLVQNGPQITAQATLDSTSGEIDEVEFDTTISDVTSGITKASNLLTRYGVNGTLAQFTTMATGYVQGQLITVNLPWFGLNSAQMLIEEVSLSDQTDGINIWYTIKAVQGPYDTTWVDFFGNLIVSNQLANSINIGVSQSLVILVSLLGSITPTALLNPTVHACPVPSATLFPSSTLFPC